MLDHRPRPRPHLMRIGTLNVGSMTGRSGEVARMMVERRVNVLCVQETRWRGAKARPLGEGVKLFYSGETNRYGVGIATRGDVTDSVTEVIRRGDRLMAVRIDHRDHRLFTLLPPRRPPDRLPR